MEMPIVVTITLFVTVAVGIGILYFSEDILSKTQNEINELGTDDSVKLEDKLIELKGISEDAIINLGEQCVKDNGNSPDRVLCYVVKSDEASVAADVNSESITVDGREFTFYVLGVDPDDNSFFMYYNPDGMIDIEG